MKKYLKLISILSLFGLLLIVMTSCFENVVNIIKNNTEVEDDNVVEIPESTSSNDTTYYPYYPSKTSKAKENTTESTLLEKDENGNVIQDEIIFDTTNELFLNQKEELDLYIVDYKTLYGYQQLLLDSYYGEDFKNIYETLYNASYNFLVSDKDYELTTINNNEYLIIYEYKFENLNYADVIASCWINMIEENPLFYFSYTGYTLRQYGSGNNKYYSFCLLAGNDYKNSNDRYLYNEAILDMTNDFLDKYNNLEEKTDYNKAKLAHDYILNKVDYAYDTDGNASNEYWAHNILGVALNKGSVCESYAECYDYLSYLMNLNTLTVVGYSKTQSSGHAWNYTEIDGVWYGVDLTWDDGDKISYDYFLVSSKIMNKAHTPYDNSSYGIEYQVELPTLSTSSIDTSLDKEDPIIPSRPGIIWPRFWF